MSKWREIRKFTNTFTSTKCQYVNGEGEKLHLKKFSMRQTVYKYTPISFYFKIFFFNMVSGIDGWFLSRKIQNSLVDSLIALP